MCAVVICEKDYYVICSLLLGLEGVFVRPCRVPSLALFATLCMVHFAPVILPVTCHADICQQRSNSYQNVLLPMKEIEKESCLLEKNEPRNG